MQIPPNGVIHCRIVVPCRQRVIASIDVFPHLLSGFFFELILNTFEKRENFILRFCLFQILAQACKTEEHRHPVFLSPCVSLHKIGEKRLV